MFLLFAAIAPAAALIIYFYCKDKHEKEPLDLLAKAFLAGIIITFVAMVIEPFFLGVIKNIPFVLFRVFLASFVMAALVEEGLKFLAFKLVIYDRKDFNEPYDGILYAVMISLGFATIENIGYIVSEFTRTGFIGAYGLSVGRALFSVTIHAFTAAIMGYYLGLAKFCGGKREAEYQWKGLGFAVLAHGSFNFFILTLTPVGILLAFVVFLVAWFQTLRAIKLHSANSPFRK